MIPQKVLLALCIFLATNSLAFGHRRAKRCVPPTQCTLEYDPVCGGPPNEEETFANQCAYDAKYKCNPDARILYYRECQPDCNEPYYRCDTGVYNPVCAGLSGQEQTYGNECLFATQFRCVQDAQILYSGVCPQDCNEPLLNCLQNYEPVCGGISGKEETYSNNCTFQSAIRCNNDARFLYDGECQKECNEPYYKCDSSVYNPVCAGLPGQEETYGNECLFVSAYRCIEDASILYDGECEKKCDAPYYKCSNVYNPVCGGRPGQEKTYDNACQFASMHRCIEDARVIYEGECNCENEQQCAVPEYCTNDYYPVCGGPPELETTFNNTCQFDKQYGCAKNAKIIYVGECEPPPCQTPTMCTKEYLPVCGGPSGQEETFGNQCTYEAKYGCTDDASILYDGECEKKCDAPYYRCTNTYSPVCGGRPGKEKTYDNACQFASMHRCVEDAEIIYEGECEPPPCQTPTMCTKEYLPVCGGPSGQEETFGNQCTYEAKYGCTDGAAIISDGECEQQQPPQCETPQICYTLYKPVCGGPLGEEETFGNDCEFNRKYGCTEGARIINEGECVKQCQTPEVCPQIYQPLCGGPPRQERTFGNECQYNATYGCTEGSRIIKEGKCEEEKCQTPTACPRIFRPVCGGPLGEEETFGNECEYNKTYGCTEGAKIINKGKCTVPPEEPECVVNVRCDTTYSEPVCGGVPGKEETFKNQCLYITKYGCTKDARVLNQGECEEKCNEPYYKCGDEYEPVCGGKPGEEETFGNCCLFKSAFRCNKDAKIISDGECKVKEPQCQTPKICTLEYGPVCGGLPGQEETYGNKCAYDSVFGCTKDARIIRNGECESGEKSPCEVPKFCGDIYSPVCGGPSGEEETFPNECSYKSQYGCTQGARIISDGACPQKRTRRNHGSWWPFLQNKMRQRYNDKSEYSAKSYY